MHTFHDPPSLRPCCSKLLEVGHPRARTKLHPGKGNLNQDDVMPIYYKRVIKFPKHFKKVN
jgi:hypothetical protein